MLDSTSDRVNIVNCICAQLYTLSIQTITVYSLPTTDHISVVVLLFTNLRAVHFRCTSWVANYVELPCHSVRIMQLLVSLLHDKSKCHLHIVQGTAGYIQSLVVSNAEY